MSIPYYQKINSSCTCKASAVAVYAFFSHLLYPLNGLEFKIKPLDRSLAESSLISHSLCHIS